MRATAAAMALFRTIVVHNARQDIVIWVTVKSCIFSSGNIYSVQCVNEPFLSPSSILISVPVGQAVEGCRSRGGRFWQISNPILIGGQITPTTSLLATIPLRIFRPSYGHVRGTAAAMALLCRIMVHDARKRKRGL